MHPRDDSEVCELEDSVHDPHDLVGQSEPGSEHWHQQRNVGSALVVWQDQQLLAQQLKYFIINSIQVISWLVTSSRLSPDSSMEYPADQLQHETMDNIQLKRTSSICQ